MNLPLILASALPRGISSCLLIGLLWLVSLAAGAATYLVTNTSDNNLPGSLRYELGRARPGDRVELDISLAGKTIVLSRSIIISGTGNTAAQPSLSWDLPIWVWWPYKWYSPPPANQELSDEAGIALPEATTSAAGPPAISGGKQTHLFEVRTGVPVIINGLILKDGYNATGNGGAIDNAGLLTIQACLLANNKAANGDGGAVNNQGGGTLTLADSTLSGNVAAFNGGGIANSGTATLQRSTVFGNIANTGGGLYTLGGMQAYQVTLSRNHANSYGGGIVSKGSGALLTFGNNLIVGNDAASVDGQEIYAATTNGFSGISNVVGQNGVASVYPSTPTGFQVNPMSRDQTLNPLTPTLAARPLCTLPRGSFAIDAGDDRVALNNSSVISSP